MIDWLIILAAGAAFAIAAKVLGALNSNSDGPGWTLFGDGDDGGDGGCD